MYLLQNLTMKSPSYNQYFRQLHILYVMIINDNYVIISSNYSILTDPILSKETISTWSNFRKWACLQIFVCFLHTFTNSLLHLQHYFWETLILLISSNGFTVTIPNLATLPILHFVELRLLRVCFFSQGLYLHLPSDPKSY